MTMVTVSPKFQIVIPQKIRESMGIKVGQKIQVLEYSGRIVLIPVIPVEKARGLLKGMDTTIEEEPDRL